MTAKKEHHRFERLGRTVKLIGDLLSGKEHDRDSAAQLLGVKPAAADRQLRAVLKLPGIVVDRRGRRRVLRFDRTAVDEPPSLATAIAACFGSSLRPLFDGTPYQSGITQARDHVLRLARRRREFRDIDRKFLFLHRGGEVSLPEQAGQLDDLIDAVLGNNWVDFEYEDFGGQVENTRVEALSIAVYDHQLYLVGRDSRGSLHPYRFARIKDLDVKPRSFSYPTRTEYDPDQVFAGSFGIFMSDGSPVQKVQLRLARRWATHVRTHRWHRSQQVAVTGNHVLVTIEVHVCPEVIAWVLGFGPDAEVVEPATLRDVIATSVANMVKIYGTDKRATAALK